MNPIKLVSQNFFKELSAASVNWLLGNIGDKIRVETTFTIEDVVISSTNSPFTVNSSDGYINTGWVTDQDNRFANFQIGDYVYYYNYISAAPLGSGNYYITDKLSNGEIRLNTAADGSGSAPPVPIDTGDSQGAISNQTPITAIKYYYNFIENNAGDNFISPIDGSAHLLAIPYKLASDNTTSQMLFMGPLTWQNGSATIQGVSASSGIVSGMYQSTFKIIHYTKITPYILETQIANQQAGINPNDFLTINKCWKFITQIEAAEAYTNPNFLVSEVFDQELGNTGWYNENFNTGKTNYSIAGLTYNNNGSITSIQLDATETTITFNVANTTDTPFTSNTKFVIGFFKVPSDPSEYQNNNTLLDQNFCYDRAYQQVGAGAVNGDNYGGAYQVLKSISAVLTNSGHIAVTCKIDMAAAVLASFNASSDPMYFLSFATQKYGVATADALNDLVNLQVDMNTFTIITSDPTMIVPTNVFIRHPEVNPVTEGTTPGIAIDPAPLNWSIAYVSGSPKIGILDQTNSKWYGTADYAVSLNATMANLVTSVNTNTSLGTIPLIGLPFDNSAGFTAAWDIPTQSFTLTAPVGSGVTYNGANEQFAYSGGSMDHDSGSVFVFTGGSTTSLDVYPQDEIVACSNFYIESSGRTTDVIKLTSVKAQIIAKNGAKSFELDQFIMLLDSIPLTGYTQQFDSQVARIFHIPLGTIRKYIEVKRRNDLDTGTRYYFSSYYPFLFRWETWTALLGVDSSFFNASLPNNGFNEWWYRYGITSGWGIYYNLTIGATKNGIAQSYNLQQLITPHDYASNAAFTTKDVLPFEASDLALLLAGAGGAKQLATGNTVYVTINGQKYYTDGADYVYTDRKTLIAAIFTKTSLPSSVCVEIDVEIYQQGGIAGKRRYSSKWVADSDTWFSSTDGSGKVVLYPYGNSIVALCYLDPTSLNFPTNASSWSFSGRIYEIGGVLETDDNVPITTDDGVQIEVD